MYILTVNNNAARTQTCDYKSKLAGELTLLIEQYNIIIIKNDVLYIVLQTRLNPLKFFFEN